MELNTTTLQTILSDIFNVDKKYIVPKIGLWFNPQSMMPTNEAPKTWIAYRIISNKAITLPVFQQQIDTVGQSSILNNYGMVAKIAEIQLQFVGSNAEDLANSLVYWIKRTDVINSFLTVQGKIMSDDLNVIATDFYQEGANNILAYNVNFKIAWKSMMLTNQEILTDIEIEGELDY